MRLLRLVGWITGISIQSLLAHRANLLFEIFMMLLGISSGIIVLATIFSHVNTLAGWTYGGSIILLGTYQIVSGLISTFVTPNLTFFQGKITSGEIDDLLLKPAPSLFMASMGTCQPLLLLQTILGVIVLGIGMNVTGNKIVILNLILYILQLIAGVTIAWSSRVLLASLSFWAPGTEPSVLYDAFWELGRYPVGVYHPYVRPVLTYIVPVAFIATFPAYVLMSGWNLLLFIGSMILAFVFFIVTRLVWYAGLRRYTSATS